jgi:hypothetical protein
LIWLSDLVGDKLCQLCPNWRWVGADKAKQATYLPPDKQYLFTKKIPCPQRAAAVTGGGNESNLDVGDGDDWVVSEKGLFSLFVVSFIVLLVFLKEPQQKNLRKLLLESLLLVMMRMKCSILVVKMRIKVQLQIPSFVGMMLQSLTISTITPLVSGSMDMLLMVKPFSQRTKFLKI